MKLTRTDAVFSRTTMVLFLCRNKSSRNGMKLFGDFLWNKRKILEPRTTGGGSLGGHNPIKSYFWRKNPGRKNYHVSRDGAAATSCSSSGGQIWSPFGAPERGIFDLRHHQPFSITNSTMLSTGSE